MTDPAPEPRAICDARAFQCRCAKDAGHDQGADPDPVHECHPDRCTGAWTGDPDDLLDFTVVRLPFPVSDPQPWEFP